MKKKKSKSNWMRGFVIPPKKTEMDLIEAERIEGCLQQKHTLLKKSYRLR